MAADIRPSYADVLATLTSPRHFSWATAGGMDDQDIGAQSVIFRTLLATATGGGGAGAKRPGELTLYNDLLRVAGPAIDADASRVPLFIPGRQARLYTQDIVLVNNSITPVNTGLGEWIARGRIYMFWGMIIYTADPSAGMRLQFALPSGGLSFHCIIAMNSAASDDDGPVTIRYRTNANPAPLIGLGTSVPAGSFIFGIGQGGSSGTGAVALQAAQLSTHSSNLTIKQGSWLEFIEY